MIAARAGISVAACLLVSPDRQRVRRALPGATRTIEGKGYIVVFRTVPDPVRIGSHFSSISRVCPRAMTEAPRSVRVDANMPEHRHGMNYRPVVTAQSSGAYRATG
jgi:hypothetical protein